MCECVNNEAIFCYKTLLPELQENSEDYELIFVPLGVIIYPKLC